jgi:hypothetical protein
MAQQQFTRQVVPQKGLWTAASADAIGPEYSPWCQNVRFRFGKILRTPGRSVTLDTSTKNFMDFVTLIDNTGSTSIFSLCGSTLSDMEMSRFGPDTNKFGIIGPVPLTAGKDLRVSWTMGEERLFIVRSSSIVAASLSGGQSFESLASPVGDYVQYFKGHLVLGNVQGFSSRLQWSREAHYYDWDDGEDANGIVHGGFLDLYDGIVEPLTGMKVLNDRLTVYRRSTITDINATGDAITPLLPENRVNGIGCLLPWSLASVGQFHIFVGNDFNVYAWDGTNLDPIGSPIHSYLRQLIDPGMQPSGWMNIPFAAVFMSFKEYWLVIPRGFAYVILIYDYFRNAWTRDLFGGPLTALFEQVLPGATGTSGFDGSLYPGHYPVMMMGAGKNFAEVDERIVGDWFTRPSDGGIDMFVDTPDMFYNPNAISNGTLERVLVSQDIPGADDPAYQVQVSIDRGNSFPYVQSILPKDAHWGFEFVDLNVSSNVRRYRFFYPKENGATRPTLRAYTDVYVPSGEFFPIERTLNPADPFIPPPNTN